MVRQTGGLCPRQNVTRPSRELQTGPPDHLLAAQDNFGHFVFLCRKTYLVEFITKTSKFHREFMFPALFLFELLKMGKFIRGSLVLYHLPKY